MSINKGQGQSLTVAGLYLQAPCFSHGSTMLGAHVLTRHGMCSFVHLVVRLGMLFTKKLCKRCRFIPVKNKHVNHFYIPHISVLCLTAFEIIPTTTLQMHAWSCQMMCCFSIGMTTCFLCTYASVSTGYGPKTITFRFFRDLPFHVPLHLQGKKGRRGSESI